MRLGQSRNHNQSLPFNSQLESTHLHQTRRSHWALGDLLRAPVRHSAAARYDCTRRLLLLSICKFVSVSISSSCRFVRHELEAQRNNARADAQYPSIELPMSVQTLSVLNVALLLAIKMDEDFRVCFLAGKDSITIMIMMKHARVCVILSSPSSYI